MMYLGDDFARLESFDLTPDQMGQEAVLMKCSQCGSCCLSAPCFAIPIGFEKWKIVDGKRIHDCPFLFFRNGKAICKNIEIPHSGECTNRMKDREYAENTKRIWMRMRLRGCSIGLDDERVELLEQDAEIEMLESMMESGILQPQDL